MDTGRDRCSQKRSFKIKWRMAKDMSEPKPGVIIGGIDWGAYLKQTIPSAQVNMSDQIRRETCKRCGYPFVYVDDAHLCDGCRKKGGESLYLPGGSKYRQDALGEIPLNTGEVSLLMGFFASQIERLKNDPNWHEAT